MVINSVISLVYYISIVRAMFFEPVAEPVRPIRAGVLLTGVVALAAAGIVAVGVFPDLFAHFPRLSTLISR
jgi:NADH:ubiquinone oxidoreductase subunit 2 (subunit N)